jgi:molybdate-binding protein
VIRAVVSGEAEAGWCTWQAGKLPDLFFLPFKAEPGYLIFRDAPDVRDEIQHLVRFLDSEVWQQRLSPAIFEKPGEEICKIYPCSPGKGNNTGPSVYTGEIGS